jgi:Uma2 family endonuclease
MVMRAIDFRRTYTSDEFEAMPEFEQKGYELLEGRLVKREMPGHEHGRIAKKIQRGLTLFDPDETLGEMLPATSFRLNDHNTTIPDLAFWRANRVIQKAGKGALQTVPDLVVEVHSPRDLETKKRREEVQHKIKGYQTVCLVWAINPGNRTIEVYYPDQPEPVAMLTINDELDGEDVIPGFRLKVSTLFE